MYYIQCAEEGSDEAIELPLEADFTLAMTTLTAQYPGASGLKFRSESGGWRGLRVTDGKVYQVDNEWGTCVYVVVYPKDNKRKGDDMAENPVAKTKKIETKHRCSDLIVLGLPYKTEEEDLKNFFGQFGEVVMAQIKRDQRTSNSKGYGFIRFKDYEVQELVIGRRHVIDGRYCDVRIPNSKGGERMSQYSRKIFVGRVSEELTKQDLKDYFTKFGEVTDVFVPTPHRAFAFVTFADPNVAADLQDAGEDHLIKGCSVNISNATAKNPDRGRTETNGYPGNQSGGSGDFGSYGNYAGYGTNQSGYGQAANGAQRGVNQPAGVGGGNAGMDMSGMMNMNPAMMQSMMQMMMMSGMMGGMGGAGGGGNSSSQSQGEKPGGFGAGKPDGREGYGYGWGTGDKSGGSSGGSGGGYGYGSGWGSNSWGGK